MGIQEPTIGLALGSGAARGLAHIGVLKVLEEHNIPIDYIAGTSMGALIGGLYASGLNAREIEQIALNINNRDMFALVDPSVGRGLIKGEKITSFIQDNLAVKYFKDCRTPFSATAIDIKTGEVIVLHSGNLADAIRASISMPLVFQPVERDGRTLVDGGVGVPVPVEIVRKMGADIVVAINLDKHYVNDDLQSGLIDIANDSMNIMRHYLSYYQSKDADIVINLDLGSNKWYDFVNGQNKILAGEEMMKNELVHLKKLIGLRKKSTFRKLLDFLKANA